MDKSEHSSFGLLVSKFLMSSGEGRGPSPAASLLTRGILLLRDWRLCRRTLMRSSSLSGLMTFEIHQNPDNEKGDFSRPSQLMTLSILHPALHSKSSQIEERLYVLLLSQV
jgi:hypothetical protein